MSKRSDFGLIMDFDCWKHPGWVQFMEVMEGRLLGSDALNMAWAFYKAGWQARGKKA